MKRITLIFMALLAMMVLPSFASCSPDDNTGQTPAPNPGPGTNPNPDPNPSTSNSMKITIGTATFTATLQDNATARALKTLLPMTVTMSEHNSNEKYYDLPGNLPTASYNPGTIYSGDIMLYGSRTLVLFYKTFSTGYGYTRIGAVDNPSGLERALGTGSVSVRFELQE